MNVKWNRTRYWKAEFVAPIFTALLGGAMLAMAFTQPSWIDGRVGPGLFARWLSAAVIAMSVVWFIASVVENTIAQDSEATPYPSPSLLPGIGLLTGVAAFAVALPITGLVIACALAAAIVSWGAGERSIGAFALSAGSGAAAALALGLTLLPPGTRLWPPGF